MSGKYWNVTKRLLTSLCKRLLRTIFIHCKALMSEDPIESSFSLSAEQKRAALEVVLNSQTFARADQLKCFLRYVCEMEIAGRGYELSEYLIGVEALGRPTNYSPGDDSAVRNRAFALRKKLQEFYELEQPESSLRIELTKGSYCPHFVEAPSEPKLSGDDAATMPSAAPLVPLTTPAELTPPDASSDKRRLPEKRRQLVAFVAGVFVAALAAGIIYWMSGGRRATAVPALSVAPILSEVWGPLLAPNADVLVCVANPPSLSVHPANSPLSLPRAISPQVQVNDPDGRPIPEELRDWYQARYPTYPDSLYLTITTNATYWGDSLGAMTALKVMHTANVSPQLFPEKVITVPTLRKRNVVLFGAPEYSPAVTRFLEKCPLTVNYLDAIICPAPGQMPATRYAVKRDQFNRMTQLYGLITVLPSESSSNHRTIIFSGVNSAGTQAAAEFFTSPDHLQALKKHLQEDGHQAFPPAYQVVVRAETDDSILLNFHYETYRIIPSP
jgi:hypothetical protein